MVKMAVITSCTSVVRVDDPDWCETWAEWCTWNIAGLRPGRPARFGIKMFNIAEDYIGGGPFLDVGSFKVEIKGTVVGMKKLSRLVTTHIDIPANLINPDGTTWVRVYGTPHNFYIQDIGVSVDQPGVDVEGIGGWLERNKGPIIVAGLAGLIVMYMVS